MAKNKLKKFADLSTLKNVFQNFDYLKPELVQTEQVVDLKGKWLESHFQNEKPLVIELACGRGEYTIGLAEQDDSKNYIGIDIKGARIWQGATIADERNYDHVAFVRTRIELLSNFFAEQELDEIWITFPDPFLKDRRANKRLTSPVFLDIYKQLLKPNGVIHLKTDNPKLYHYSLQTLTEDTGGRITFHHNNIYTMDYIPKALEINTYYEQMHLNDNCSIKYIQYQLNG